MIRTSKRREEELRRQKELEARVKRDKAAKRALTVGAIGAGVAGIAAFLKTEKGQETLEVVYDKTNDAVTIVKKYATTVADKAKELVKSNKDDELFYVDGEDEIVISKEFDEKIGDDMPTEDEAETRIDMDENPAASENGSDKAEGTSEEK